MFGLVLIDIKGFFVQGVSDGVRTQFFVRIEGMKMSQGLSIPSKVVVNFKVSSKFRGFLELAEEWQIFTRVLSDVRMSVKSRSNTYPLGLLRNHESELKVIEA